MSASTLEFGSGEFLKTVRETGKSYVNSILILNSSNTFKLLEAL